LSIVFLAAAQSRQKLRFGLEYYQYPSAPAYNIHLLSDSGIKDIEKIRRKGLLFQAKAKNCRAIADKILV
jgi:hypothetical protein